jgi:hypothetical protein
MVRRCSPTDIIRGWAAASRISQSKAPMQYSAKSRAWTKPCPGAKRMSLVSKL